MHDEHEHEHRARAEQGAFKIVDRRRFTAAGDVRADAPVDAGPRAISPIVKAPQSAGPQPEPAPAPKAAAQGAQPARRSASSVDFLSFVSSLASNAVAAMGLLPAAQSRGVAQNLDMAREYLEIIVMLQERTSGNLSPEEDHALTQLIADLTEQYVALHQRAQTPT